MKPNSLLIGLGVFAQAIRGLNITQNGAINMGLVEGATQQVAAGLLDYYEGTKLGGTIGMFTYPYYWWNAGTAFGSLVDYWFYMQNDTYVALTKQALLYQVGDNMDYVPANQSTTEGNDDQAMWGLTVMAAAERNFSNPNSTEPGWLYLSQAVFNTMASRWDTTACGGGLRWQIFRWNNGYDYKNSVSNGALFHMAGRLARYTSNDSYVEWAEKVWDWMWDVHFINVTNGWWGIYDGADTAHNCSNISHLQWTYNMGLMMAGSAYIYNYTRNETWLTRTEGLVNGSRVFFNNSIAYEAACQPAKSCNNDQRTFKAIFVRCLGLTALMAPSTNSTIMPWLQTSAIAASGSCDGGRDGHTCGLNWFLKTYDNNYGLGEEMAALEVMQNLNIWNRPPPLTASTGGTSAGDGAAGGVNLAGNATQPLNIQSKDKGGAAIITVIAGISIIGSAVWLVL